MTTGRRAESRKKVWTEQRVRIEKLAVKAELEEIERSSGAKAKFRHALFRIRELQDDESPAARLRCFLFVVSALLHAARNGGLKRAQVSRLARLAEAILAAEGVRTSSARLAVLYGDLYLAISHWHWYLGDHWRSAWAHQLSRNLSGRNPPGGEGFQLLARGIRAMRLGHLDLALSLLERAERKGLKPRALLQARIQRARALRLNLKFREAERLLASSLQLDFSSEERLDLEWEALCLQVARTGKMDPIGRAVLPGRSHHSYAYILEAFLWSRSLQDKTWMTRLRTIRKIGHTLKLRPREHGALYHCATALERCYDADIPLVHRLRWLGEALSRVKQLPTIDKELLMWAAAARWLSRVKSEELAALVVAEYRGIGLRATGGTSGDPLGIAKDLLERARGGAPATSEEPADAPPIAAIA